MGEGVWDKGWLRVVASLTNGWPREKKCGSREDGSREKL